MPAKNEELKITLISNETGMEMRLQRSHPEFTDPALTVFGAAIERLVTKMQNMASNGDVEGGKKLLDAIFKS